MELLATLIVIACAGICLYSVIGTYRNLRDIRKLLDKIPPEALMHDFNYTKRKA